MENKIHREGGRRLWMSGKREKREAKKNDGDEEVRGGREEEEGAEGKETIGGRGDWGNLKLAAVS